MKAHLLFLALFPAVAASAQTPVTIELEAFAAGLDDVVDIAHAGDERLFAVLQTGYIHVVSPDGTVLPTPFLDIDDRVSSGGERGLLGLAFDPNYAQNGFFYVNYTYGTSPGSSRVSRFQVTANPDSADAESEVIIWTWPQPASNNNGGDLDFGPDGLLYFPMGDGGGGGSANAQDLSDPLGDIIRIDVSDPDTTYTIPPTNPFATASGDTLPEIWSSGLRNPFRFGFDVLTGDMWIGDVGSLNYEEIDFRPAATDSWLNYGWPCYEGNNAYNTIGCLPQSAYVFPVSVHSHGAQSWCSIMGGRVYRGSASQRLYGRYLYTDYCGGQFYSLHPDADGGWIREQVRPVAQSGFTCIGENSALELFVGDKSGGIIYHIVDPCPMAGPVVTQDDNVLTSSEPSGNQWYLNGEPIAGATEQTYTITASGSYYVVVEMAAGCELASQTIQYIWTGVGVHDAADLRVLPTPATDQLVLEGMPAEARTMALLDMAGRELLTERLVGGTRLVLDISGIAAGQYALVLRNVEGLPLAQRQVSIARSR